MDYILHILIVTCLYAILAVSLNLISGYTGIISLGHAAFYGIGAYSVALGTSRWDASFWLVLLIAVFASVTVGVVVGIPSLRIRGDYFIIATFAFQVIAFSVMNNWISFTGGPMGIAGIPQPLIFGLPVTSRLGFFVLAMIFSTLCYIAVLRIVRSPFGRILRAIREDEVLASALGKNVAYYKIQVFIMGAVIAAVAGVLYGYYISFVDPSSFTVLESVFIISIVIIGGAGNVWGSLIGATLLVILPEALRFVGMPSSIAANVRQILYGAALVACMMFRPQGIMGEFAFRKK